MFVFGASKFRAAPSAGVGKKHRFKTQEVRRFCDSSYGARIPYSTNGGDAKNKHKHPSYYVRPRPHKTHVHLFGEYSCHR